MFLFFRKRKSQGSKEDGAGGILKQSFSVDDDCEKKKKTDQGMS